MYPASFFYCVLLSLFLVGCRSAGSQEIHAKPYTKTQAGVTLHAKAIAENECRNPYEKKALEEGYQPIEITISNNSSTDVAYTAESLKVATVSAQEIARSMTNDDRAVTWSVGAFLLWPMVASAKESLEDVGGQLAQAVLEIVPAKQTKKGLIFIPKDEYNGVFNVTLTETKSSKKIGFEVKIFND